ncbi:3-keto-5-aminohexanoate cleavage protein [Oceanibium sediminis]|uniref:3-keto-5-aminohexanoate cleavage protein n=1 Tax=Oceanibium sediminis TaxID=2026339 RepID=UPI000DD34D05|nr:3-keto-5-aminohexanoate cleavage protein [Oceanibium sediminis]
MSKKTILTCAVSGNITTTAQAPGLPVTPIDIAAAAVEAQKAGAAVVHIHVRDLQTQEGSMDLNLYREVVDRIRDAGSDVILNLTTGEGGRYVPSPDNPLVPVEGTTLTLPEKRIAHVSALKPEICTLDFNTMNNRNWVVMNTPTTLERMLDGINDAGTVPEVEIFDSGDLNLAKNFISRDLFKKPPIFQIVLGVNYGAAPNPETLAYLVSQLPAGYTWAAFGIGRFAFPAVALSYLSGGHVRIGMEDTIYLSKGVPATSNAQLVEKAVRIVEDLGGSMATSAEAREIIGLDS